MGSLDWRKQGEGVGNLTATTNCTGKLHGVAGSVKDSVMSLPPSVWVFLLVSHYACSVRLIYSVGSGWIYSKSLVLVF